MEFYHFGVLSLRSFITLISTQILSKMDPKEVLSGSRRPNRHRSRKQKDRVAKRAAHQQREEEEDAQRMEKIDFLERNLVFKRVRFETHASFTDVSFAKGQQISRKLSSFLRHGMQNENFCHNDGSVPLTDLAKLLKVREEWILAATSPAYDKNNKRRFAVIENIHADGNVIVSVAALGGHSIFIPNPIGQYQMGAESLDIYGQLVHNTSAKKQIEESGFLSQQGRKGGINLATMQVADQYRPMASHRIVIRAKECLARGIFFFGNRFSEIVYCTGSWEGNEWNGKIPISTHLLRFEER